MFAYLVLFLIAPLLPVAPGNPVQQGSSVVLRAGRMLDVREGRVLEDVVIVVRRGLIVAVNPERTPAELPLIDLGDRFLLPGLIDCHTHLTADLEGDFLERRLRESPADWALRGAYHARRTLQAGFTTVRDLGSGGFADVALARAIDRGLVEGPRIIPAGHAIGMTGGHGDALGLAPGLLAAGPLEGVADGVSEVVKAVRLQAKHGARVIKVCATAGVLSLENDAGAQQYSAEELEALVAEAHRQGLRVAAHAHGRDGILAAIRADVDSIEHGSVLDDEVIAALLEWRTPLVPTAHLAEALDLAALPPDMRAKAEELLPLARQSLRRAIAAGVRIVFGTDAAVIPHGSNAREFATLVEAGLSPLEAVRAATLHADELLGFGDRGVIEPGRLADFIAVTGNPLEDVRRLEEPDFVMKGGVAVRLTTR